MVNILISIAYLLLSFTLTLLCYKHFGKVGMFVWMSVMVVVCNIQTIKMSEIFGLTISLGNVSYGAIFLSTDILSEKYGKKAASQAINMSFYVMIVFTLLMNLFLQYKPGPSDTSQSALEAIFTYMPRITIASLLAYFCSQKCDTWLYQKLKQKYKKIWISNNVSTFVSQILDTVIFVLISFLGTMSVAEVFQIMLTMILFKWIIALIDTPFIIFATKLKNIKEVEVKPCLENSLKKDTEI